MDARRDALRALWTTFFDSYDFLVCPTASTPAFEHNQKGDRWERLIPVELAEGGTLMQPTTDALFWAGYPGLVGLPACAIPLGLSEGGLPVGAQIVGPAFGDPDVLRMAMWLEREFRAFVPPPGL
jgi:amidase